MTVKPGEKVLIVGPNGSGKTTLCHLIVGLFCPQIGEVRTLPLEQFSYVPMYTPVLPWDIKRQISMGIPERERKLEELLYHFPMTLNESGNLSDGELQKINILRTLVKDAKVYLFDEPFQHLDSRSVRTLTRIIKEALKDKTLIIVSHRDDFVKEINFDKVIHIGGGKHENNKCTSN